MCEDCICESTIYNIADEVLERYKEEVEVLHKNILERINLLELQIQKQETTTDSNIRYMFTTATSNTGSRFQSRICTSEEELMKISLAMILRIENDLEVYKHDKMDIETLIQFAKDEACVELGYFEMTREEFEADYHRC